MDLAGPDREIDAAQGGREHWVTRPILIDGATICEGAEAYSGAVLVEQTRITCIAWSEQERRDLGARAAEVVDAAGRRVIPGLVDAHAHGYRALLRGTENSLPLDNRGPQTVCIMRYGVVNPSGKDTSNPSALPSWRPDSPRRMIDVGQVGSLADDHMEP